MNLGHQLDQHTMGYLTYSTKLRMRNHDEGLELEEEESGMCSMLVLNFFDQISSSLPLRFGKLSGITPP